MYVSSLVVSLKKVKRQFTKSQVEIMFAIKRNDEKCYLFVDLISWEYYLSKVLKPVFQKMLCVLSSSRAETETGAEH